MGQELIPMKMNTKFIAALAVFAMAFAGFGAMAVTEANDAADESNDGYVIAYKGFVEYDEEVPVVEIATGMYYRALIDENIEEEITVTNLKYYEAMEDATLATKHAEISGEYIVWDASASIDKDIMTGIKTFTSAEYSKTGKLIGGVETMMHFIDAASAECKTVLDADVILDVIDTEDAEAAVEAAVALIEAFYADYSSPEEVQAAIDAAVAQYKDYLSPEAVEKAKQAAVQKYIDEHPAVEKENKAFFYAFIVVLAALIAVGGVFAYKDYVKPKMAAKKAAVEAVEPPKQ